MKANLVGLIELTLEIDIGVSLWELFLLSHDLSANAPIDTPESAYRCDEIHIEPVHTERTLELVIGRFGRSLAVDLESLKATLDSE